MKLNCLVCKHPDLPRIDFDLAGGLSRQDIAQRYGIAYKVLSRHAVRHLREKSPDAFKTVAEAAIELDVPQHVLRFWEVRFKIRLTRTNGKRRYYRPTDMALFREIHRLLYVEKYRIEGAKQVIERQMAEIA